LSIFLQVNTSREDQKSGISPEELLPIFKEIHENSRGNYDHVLVRGLMTIGKFDGDPTEDFQILRACRDSVATSLAIDPQKLELSMGMSADYKLAIEMGSTNIRVGSTIFGERETKHN